MLGAGSGLCDQGGSFRQGWARLGERAGRCAGGGAVSVWGSPCWGAPRCFDFRGSPAPTPRPSPPCPLPSLPSPLRPSKRPDDAPSHDASGVQRRGHSVAAMLGPPCSRPTRPRWARHAAGPHRATRAGPAQPLPLGARAALSPSYRPRPRQRRSTYPAGTGHPAPGTQLRATPTSARAGPAEPPNDGHTRRPSQHRAPSLAATPPTFPCRPAPPRRTSCAQVRRAPCHPASVRHITCRTRPAVQPDRTRQLQVTPARPDRRSDGPGSSSVPIQALCQPSECRRSAARRQPPGFHRHPGPSWPVLARGDGGLATPLGSGRRS